MDTRCNGTECRTPRKQVQRLFKQMYLPPNGYYIDVADDIILIQLLDSWVKHGNLFLPYEFAGREVRVFKYD